MKKVIVLLSMIFLTLLVVPSVLALELEVEKLSANEVVISGLNEPASFDLRITNLGSSENVVLYSFFTQEISPKELRLESKKTQDVTLKIYPSERMKPGYYTFDYFIRNNYGDEVSQTLTIDILNFEDAFEIGSQDFNPESKTLNVYIHNKVNFNFENVVVVFKSPFFEFKKEFNLGPNQRNDFTITLDKEDFKKLMAGYYTFEAEIEAKGLKGVVEGTLKFSEKDILTTTKKTYGLIINTNVIEKVNEGNVLTKTETVIKKNVLSRLFTHFSPEPNTVEREGLVVYYTWYDELSPGEVLKINVKTNWLLPFVIVLLIVLVVILVKKNLNRNIVLKKKVSFVHAKGGEFALKVMILVEAKSFLERISIIDRLPYLTKVHERFGGEQPSRIDDKNKRIEWNFERMQPGERRVFSYIIYSKIGVLGKFALPSVTAVYEKEGKVKEAQSNQAFFMLEPRATKDLEGQ
ncbi:MAG TPA: hypothetical protein PLT60_03435 [Candidatus Pacearchaeota archaeon]|nr:hypothetical protein [Candidatus Pacearchaeota archaeon]HPX74892.1 hypothetical protein [Candidatus Pacearchaeota archaeon]HQC61104.1 hypothetical protein [Candidatus Pacearchaeota archaeon]